MTGGFAKTETTRIFILLKYSKGMTRKESSLTHYNNMLKNITSLILASLVGGLSAENERLNVILIMADDLGYETIAANGGESYKTPNIDRMASQGVRFEHCYAQPVCTASRVKIMTGLSNVRNYTRFGNLDREQKTFAHYFKDAGYATAIAGKWQLGNQDDSPQHFGFDEALLWQHQLERWREGTQHDSRFENPVLEYNGEPRYFHDGEYGPDVLTDYVCEFITRKKDQPFLAYYPMVLAHCPFVPTPDCVDWYPTSKGSLTYVGDTKYFGAMVTYMDKLVGRIVDHVESLGIADQTVILFTGDNGTDKPVTSRFMGREVKGGKKTTKDAGTRVPLIAYNPALIRPQVSKGLVDFSDFLPTLCDIGGIEVAPGLDGHSFWPHLRGEQGTKREWVYCWYSPSGKAKSARVFARTERYKLYSTGEFYDIETDVNEKQAMKVLSLEQEQIQKKLSGVIQAYAQYR